VDILKAGSEFLTILQALQDGLFEKDEILKREYINELIA